jgi:hypothetical protein
MALADYDVPRRPVKTKTLSMSVRGFGTEDLTRIMNARLPDLVQFANFAMEVRAGGAKLTPKMIDSLIFKTVIELPWLVAEIISVCSDETDPASGPSLVERARKMPMPLQIKILTDIFALTFDEAGGIKNWYAETVRELSQMLDASGGLSPQLLDSLKTTLTAKPN